MKNKTRLLTPFIILASVVAFGTASSNRVRAQDVTTPENASTNTVWYPVSLTGNYLTDYYFTQGGSTLLHGTVYNYDYNTPHTVLISTEIYDAATHKRVAETVYDNVHLDPMAYVSIEAGSPRTLPAGQYYFAVGVFDPVTMTQLGWFPGYQYFTVAQ